MTYCFWGGIITCLLSIPALSQDTTMKHVLPIPHKYIEVVSRKAADIDNSLDKSAEKILTRIRRREAKMKKRLLKLDSLAANNVFANAGDKYQELEQRLKTSKAGQYIPSLDTMLTSVRFLEQNPQLLSQAKEMKEKLSGALKKVNGMKEQFQKAEEIKKFLKERKQYLKEQLSKLGFAKQLKKLNKEVHYYTAQVTEYKNLLKDTKAAERKALELLSKSRLFKDFMRKNSQLSSLFRPPGDPNDPSTMTSLAGLQTRTQVNGLIQQWIGAGGQQQFSQNVQAAQTQMNQLKNKISQFGGGSSDSENPEGFRPNEQRTKPLKNKIELSANIQNNRGTGITSVSSDVGVSAGFKANNWLITGLGFAGRIGWGKDIRHIEITYSGISARTFMEIKIKPKGSFYALAAFEMNYRPQINDIDQLKSYSSWQSSGLLGVSKTVSVTSKFFKKTKLQLMWDYLSYRQIPRIQQPILFRISYVF